ncbi:MAG: hypothetical protein ACJ8BW_20155 [Ktedonobacteraceae bacterium]
MLKAHKHLTNFYKRGSQASRGEPEGDFHKALALALKPLAWRSVSMYTCRYQETPYPRSEVQNECCPR